MGIGLDFYAIKVEALESAPPCIKQFVDDFFVDREIFGIPCAVAMDCDLKAPWIDRDDEDYLEGLTEEEINDNGVFSWFDNHPEVVFNYHWS